MSTPSPATMKPPVSFQVDGMDCAGCARRIETALASMPGLRDIRVDFPAGTLTVALDAALTAPDAVIARLQRLGFGAQLRSASPAHPVPAGAPWWRTGRGRLVLSSGGLLGLAVAASLVVPAFSEWMFAAAAVVGLIPLAARALAAARHGTPFGIETLVTVAAGGAIAIGAAAEAAVVVFLFCVGELLEAIAAQRARTGISALVALMPRTALRERDGRIETVPAETLLTGDVALVRPGDRMPADGTILDGTSDIDESPVTGESATTCKAAGAQVFAGSINATGTLRVAVTAAAADSTLARIRRLVEDAQARKSRTTRLVERFSARYTPAAMGVALLVMTVPPLALGEPWTEWLYRGFALLLIACPCALVISTPTAIAAALAAGARRGLLVKSGAALETLGRLRRVAFDKTGTLTAGQFRLHEIVAVDNVDPETVLAVAAAVEHGSSHPIARALVAAAAARGIATPAVAGLARAVPGEAVLATLADGSTAAVGSPRHALARHALARHSLARHSLALQPLPTPLAERIQSLEATGQTVVVVLLDDRTIGAIGLRDEPRPDAAPAIARLRALGVRPVMLTGDNQRAGAAIAAELDLDFRAGLLPEAKLAALRELQADGPVAMVGDGINDAPSLAAASVGIAMGGGTDVALETADAALLGNRVSGAAELVALARATLTNIRQNLALALGLKAVFLATTLLGTTTLWMAVLADTGATVLVTANAMRLLRFSFDARDAGQDRDRLRGAASCSRGRAAARPPDCRSSRGS